VDKDEKIFKNFNPFQNDKTTNAIFVSYPGSLGFNRYYRGLIEYSQFVYLYILTLLILGLAFFPQRQRVLLTILILFTTFYTLVADKSCTLHSR
jgi:glucan phosphoethanolaminetransferase (alkaline phosphatase superfamily)